MNKLRKNQKEKRTAYTKIRKKSTAQVHRKAKTLNVFT